jgi:CMP/dCMP kinase
VNDVRPLRVIAIDGPAGAGKSTIGRALAHRLGLEYLDTGAMYRGVTFAALRLGIDPDDIGALANIVEDVGLELDDDHWWSTGSTPPSRSAVRRSPAR